MHILLTDVLSCPRCGPDWGLIVLADRLEARRVVDGRLGCANCREEYPVRGGVADLRLPGAAPAPGVAPVEAAEDAGFRLAALLGLGETTGTIVVYAASPEVVGEVARLLPAVQVVGVLPEPGTPKEMEGVSWLRHGTALPFRSRGLRGVAVSGVLPLEALGELARVLAPGARLVLDPAPAGAASRLAEHGLQLLLEQEGVMVASAS